MKTPFSLLRSRSGFTVAELILTLAIMSILVALVSASYDTLQARIRCSKVKADMNAIANAGYTDYSYNGVWDVATLDGTEPPSIAAENLLSRWPQTPCPGMFYSWDNFTPAFNIVRVSLRREDLSALWSYCVDAGGGGDCDMPDPAQGGSPIEVSSGSLSYLYCNE